MSRAAAAAAAAADDDTDAAAAGLPVFLGVGGGGELPPPTPPPETCGAIALTLALLPPPLTGIGTLLAAPRAATARGVLDTTGGLSVPFDAPTPTITGGLPAAAPAEPATAVEAAGVAVADVAVVVIMVAVAAVREPELRPTEVALDVLGEGAHDETDEAHDADSADDNNGAGGALTPRSSAAGALSPVCC